jgi:hypothetical protein
MKKTGSGIVVAALCAGLLAAALPALAADEVSRAEYKAMVEPICKTNTEANDKILKGVRSKVQQGKLKPAGRQFIRAAAALQKALRQLKAVPRPAADEERLSEWLKRIGDQQVLLQKIGKALIEEKRRKAESLSAKLFTGARLTNAVVVSFGFNHCRFETSNYT